MDAPKTLLALVEFLAHAGLRPVYERLGYRVISEFSARKAIAALRRERPAVIVADFYYQPDFRDRVSNLESLLATAQGLKDRRVLVFYDPAQREALDKLGQRFQIDAALTTPVNTAALEDTLRLWRS